MCSERSGCPPPRRDLAVERQRSWRGTAARRQPDSSVTDRDGAKSMVRKSGRKTPSAAQKKRSSITTLGAALDHAGARPPDNADRDKKKNYAQRLSNAIAILIANKLRATGSFRGILPRSDGSGAETTSASAAAARPTALARRADRSVKGGRRLLTLDEVIAETVREYGIRNRTYIRWADEPSEADAPPNVVPDAVIEEEEQEDGND